MMASGTVSNSVGDDVILSQKMMRSIVLRLVRDFIVDRLTD